MKRCERSPSHDAIFALSIIAHKKQGTMDILNGISWAQFSLAIIIGLLIYYGVIKFRSISSKFKRHEDEQGKPGVKKRVWTSAEQTNLSTTEQLNEFTEADLSKEEWEPTPEDLEEEKVFESLETLASEIEEIFFDRELLIDKTKLINRLEDRIRAHPLLTGAAFKNAIVNLITRKAFDNNVSLVRAEAFALWPE